ncbi:hypothetical protein [Sterolibacterium denitrificans]|uniref:hypothetical protein n=1 Tax=Sterolibacterium denitrificans TaxID=157592 RepID=UPI0012B6991C|nr:hypothetical protein [Sterolibacterium denitrificans]
MLLIDASRIQNREAVILAGIRQGVPEQGAASWLRKRMSALARGLTRHTGMRYFPPFSKLARRVAGWPDL